ncbi:MarR family transcriptional regulator [Actinoallomurus soli]|uniref:MarR family transcriptional regulator n=1 Tax=Actinoallomurus soli TaxID=2952535 RepID=UPI0020937056|nr:MarR family transcriptional regulator [Actinoallomurus soli]MCO5974483.1 MarR family transcriptional regulator [Actinoallomurus soli]
MSDPGSAMSGPHDSVDRLLAGWAAVRPDLDLSPVAIVARLGRLRQIFDTELAATYSEYGLNGADFYALVTLRRLDRPGGVSQRRLMRELNLSSGTVSVRVERLVERGLVTRSPDTRDRRNSLVRLTDAGRSLFERVTPAHVATENRLLAALGEDERDALAALLRRLLISFEGWTTDETFPRLGLTLAPAHVTVKIRGSVGLPETLGLLVRAVEPESRADHAGLRTGDVLVLADGRPLRSVTTLYTAVSRGRDAGKLTLSAVRGADAEFEAVLDLHPGSTDERPPGRAIGGEATYLV